MLPSASVLAYRREERVQKAFSGDHHGHGDGRAVCARATPAPSRGVRCGTARVHPDGASNLLMLSVRSCCSSSTTHRRTLPDHVGYFSVTFSDGGEMEARRRRDGGETEASWRRAGGELEARRRRRRDGRRRRGGGEMADGGERRRRNGGEKAAAAATRLATTRVARTAMLAKPPSAVAPCGSIDEVESSVEAVGREREAGKAGHGRSGARRTRS